MGVEHVDSNRRWIKDYDKLEDSAICDGSFTETEIEILDWSVYGRQLDLCKANIE
jgi:hypothetical protein